MKGVGFCMKDVQDWKSVMARYEQELLMLQEKAVPVISTATEPPASPTATLQVRVTAANEAIPIANALVVIRGENNAVQQIQLTDISGLTPPLTLPATDPALTLQPEETIPLVLYTIEVSAPGYYRIKNLDVPLFGGIATVQPVSMIPLPEFEEPDRTELEYRIPKSPL